MQYLVGLAVFLAIAAFVGYRSVERERRARREQRQQLGARAG